MHQNLMKSQEYLKMQRITVQPQPKVIGLNLGGQASGRSAGSTSSRMSASVTSSWPPLARLIKRAEFSDVGWSLGILFIHFLVFFWMHCLLPPLIPTALCSSFLDSCAQDKYSWQKLSPSPSRAIRAQALPWFRSSSVPASNNFRPVNRCVKRHHKLIIPTRNIWMS